MQGTVHPPVASGVIPTGPPGGRRLRKDLRTAGATAAVIGWHTTLAWSGPRGPSVKRLPEPAQQNPFRFQEDPYPILLSRWGKRGQSIAGPSIGGNPVVSSLGQGPIMGSCLLLVFMHPSAWNGRSRKFANTSKSTECRLSAGAHHLALDSSRLPGSQGRLRCHQKGTAPVGIVVSAEAAGRCRFLVPADERRDDQPGDSSVKQKPEPAKERDQGTRSTAVTRGPLRKPCPSPPRTSEDVVEATAGTEEHTRDAGNVVRRATARQPGLVT